MALMWRTEKNILANRLMEVQEPQLFRKVTNSKKSLLDYNDTIIRNNESNVFFGKHIVRNNHTDPHLTKVINLNVNQNSTLDEVTKHKIHQEKDIYAGHSKPFQAVTPLPMEEQRKKIQRGITSKDVAMKRENMNALLTHTPRTINGHQIGESDLKVRSLRKIDMPSSLLEGRYMENKRYDGFLESEYVGERTKIKKHTPDIVYRKKDQKHNDSEGEYNYKNTTFVKKFNPQSHKVITDKNGIKKIIKKNY